MKRGRGQGGSRGRRRGQEGARTRATEPMTLTVAELAPGGSGVAIAEWGGERRAVFVDGVLPGERVEADVDRSTRPARGRLLRVLEPSAERVAPACRHQEACGACDWMHMTAGARARAHGEMLERLLRPTFPGAAVRVHAPASDVGYRVRARVHVEGRGAPAGFGGAGRGAGRGAVKVGMFGRGTRDPVEVDTCIVLDPALEAARRALADLLHGAKGRGEAQLSLGAACSAGGEPGVKRKAVLDLRWRGREGLPREVFARAEEAVRTGALAGVRIFDGDVTMPAVIGDPTPYIAGADGPPLRLAPGGFSQASELGNAALCARVAELAKELAPSGTRGEVLELYSGAGNLTVLLARGHAVVAVESDRDACVAARANLAARGLSARVVESDASAHVIPASTRLVVLDPPRTGAKEVARALAARPGPAVVYVSCDPSTLARDLGTLGGAGYELASVDAFEMFPQTSHVETVAALVHAKGRR